MRIKMASHARVKELESALLNVLYLESCDAYYDNELTWFQVVERLNTVRDELKILGFRYRPSRARDIHTKEVAAYYFGQICAFCAEKEKGR